MNRFTIFDGHNDTLLSTTAHAFLNGNLHNQLDYPRAIRGGMIGGIFSINVQAKFAKDEPENNFTKTRNGYKVKLAPSIDHSYAKEFTDKYLKILTDIINLSNKKVKLVKSCQDLTKNMTDNSFSILLHFEGAEMIDDHLKLLPYYYDRGLRVLQFVWSRPNNFATGVPFIFPSTPDIGKGLTELGIKLVRKCNEMGISVDLAHINEQGFWDLV